MGVLAALTTVIIWGAGFVLTRLAVTTSLTPFDLAFLRFAIPSVLLLPVLFREGLAIRHIGILRSLMMVAGAGLPFYLVGTFGMEFAPAAHAGALMPGTMPLFVAGLAALVDRERFGVDRLAGYFAIALGACAIAGGDLLAEVGRSWQGDFLFLAAAAMWAGYTMAFRRAGIGAWHAAALINVYSLLAFAPAYLFLLEPRLLTAPIREVAVQALVQGLLSGLVAMLAYGLAVARLGAAIAAAFGSLAPVITALVALPMLGEMPSGIEAMGIAAVSIGVVLASGVAGRPRIPRPLSPHLS